jgi:hypothetical protein
MPCGAYTLDVAALVQRKAAPGRRDHTKMNCVNTSRGTVKAALASACFLFVSGVAHAQNNGAVNGDLTLPSHGPTCAATAMQTLTPLFDRWNGGIQLYAMTPAGIQMQPFDGTFWNWGSWQFFGNQSGWPVVGGPNQSHWDPMLTGLSWNDRTSFAPQIAPRVNLFHEFTVMGTNGLPAIWLGEPWRVQPPGQPMNYNYAWDPTPTGGYWPKSTFGQAGGQINVWGTDTAAHHPYLPASSIDRNIFGPPAQSLVERFWSGSGWSWARHGSPDGYGSEILLGPCGSAWVDSGTIGVVGIVEDRFVAQEPVVHTWDSGRGRWGWLFLGSPSSSFGHTFVHAYRAPLVVAYQKGGEWFVRLFVVGLFNSSGVPSDTEWRLFSIERRPDGLWYDERGTLGLWNDHGTAPNITKLVNNRGDVNGNPFGFDMTARVVWNDGTRTRVNLFGHSDRGDQMTEFFFDGSTWKWGLTPHPNPAGSSSPRLYCDGAVAANRGGSNLRISAFVHLADGQIWERRFDFRLGGGWIWERRR